jgi:hypothetical protein
LPAEDEDPFAMFGGPPPAASGSSTNLAATAAVPIADVDDGFLDAFAPPPRQPQQEAQQQHMQEEQQQQASGGSLQSGEFGDFLGPQGYGAAPAGAAGTTSSAPPAGSAGSSSGWQGASTAGASGPTSSFGYEPRPAAAASGQSRYKVFDYVDSQTDSPTAGRPPAAAVAATSASSGGSPLEDGLRVPAGGGDPCSQQQQVQGRRPAAAAGGAGAGALHPEAYSLQQQQQGPKEVVSDLGQKAAKALQSGTKWFMKASKTLVTQVQQRLDHGGVVHGGAGSAAAGPRPAQQQQQQGPGEPAPFHYDWAAQLARISPGSRSAALGAMTEDDRLAVQVGASVCCGQCLQ